jgi:hypothetical protein
MTMIQIVIPPLEPTEREGTPECGTVRGYLAHQHHAQPACDNCALAWDLFTRRPSAPIVKRKPRPHVPANGDHS